MEGGDIERICMKQDPDIKESFKEVLSALDVSRLINGNMRSIKDWV